MKMLPCTIVCKGREPISSDAGIEKKKKVLLTSKTAPQDAHMRLMLQVYLGSNTSELSAIRKSSLLLSH